MAKERPGMILYFDDLEAVGELSDAELGQLVRLLKDYELTGERQEPKGYVGMAYSFMIPKFERDRVRYIKSCKQRSDAAKKRWEKVAAEREANANACESDAEVCEDDANVCGNDATAYAEVCESMQKEEEKENEEENKKEKENEHEHENETEEESTAPAQEAGEASCGGDGSVKLSSELISLIARYQEMSGERYALVKENFLALAKQYGTDWLSRATECAIKSGNMQISYLRGILRNWQEAGKPDEQVLRPKQKPRSDNPALWYEQRTDSLEKYYMDL